MEYLELLWYVYCGINIIILGFQVDKAFEKFDEKLE